MILSIFNFILNYGIDELRLIKLNRYRLKLN
jgi:hypothetical protein